MGSITKRINNKEKQKSQNTAACLDSSDSRKRAYIALLALNTLVDYLREKGIGVNTTNNCYNNPLILNEFDVADIKLENNLRIDVRAIVGETYSQMWIPRDHGVYQLSPDIYVGVKINKKLDKAEFVGFIEGRNLNSSCGSQNYIFVDVSSLRPMSDLLGAVNSIVPKQHIYLSVDHSRAKDLFLSYLDSNISELNKEFLIKHLATCESCRTDFYDLYGFNSDINSISKDELLYYLNLGDYEGKLPNFDGLLTSLNNPEIVDKALINIADSAHKLSLLGNLKSLFSKKAKVDKPQYVGLSSFIHPVREQMNKAQIENALDLLYNSSDHYHEVGADTILQELDDARGCDRIQEADITEEISDDLSENNIELIESDCKQEMSDENNKIHTRKYVRNFRSAVRLVEIKEEINAECESITENEVSIEIENYVDIENPICSDDLVEMTIESVDNGNQIDDYSAVNEENTFEISDDGCDNNNNAENSNDNLLENIAQEYNFNEINKSNLLEKSIESAKQFNYQNISVDDSELANMLAQLDDVEVIDGLEAMEALMRNTKNSSAKVVNLENQQLSCDDDEIESLSKKAYLIKAAAVLTAAGVITCAGLMFNDFKSRPVMNTPRQEIHATAGYTQTGRIADSKEVALTNNSQEQNINEQAIDQSSPTKSSLQDHLNRITSQPTNSYSAGTVINKNRNVNDILANAFVNQGNGIKISNVSWEVGISLANDPVFKNYFMVTGQAIKMALSRDLLGATDSVTSDQIKVVVNLDMNGNILNSKIMQSSGSKQVDGIVLQTLKEIFNYTKLPKTQASKKNIETGIIINL